MHKIWSRLTGLGWKWRLLLLALVVVIGVVVVAPSVYYLSRARDAPDYSEILPKATMTYLVSYDSGDGLVNESTYTLKVAEIDVAIGSDACFYTVTEMDPLPERKVNAIVVGSTKVTLAADEIWRSQEDLRILREDMMQVNLPIVNTSITEKTFSAYNDHPDWPYSLGDSWTYEVFCDPDTYLQPDWTDTYRAEVVADDEVVVAADVEYRCFKVVHTLVDTENSTPGGGGVGSTRVEYWANNGRSIAPIKIESTVTYVGTESLIMVDSDPPPGSW